MSHIISGQTKLTGLLGHPVKHSISPLMHNLSFKHLGLDYVYLCFDTTEESLKDVLKVLTASGIQGFNCTMPVKNAIYHLIDHHSPAASFIKAVNTVKIEQGKLIGYNTDGIGYMESVKDAGFHMPGEKITLLGNGGAATSICVQAALDGVREIDIYARKTGKYWGRTESLIPKLEKESSCKLNLYEYEDDVQLHKSIGESKFLVHATSVGMSPNVDDCILKDLSYFHDDLIVSDIIYEPRESKLLKMAKSAGCQTFNGLYMLLYQGAAAFKIWTGQEMPIELVKNTYFKE